MEKVFNYPIHAGISGADAPSESAPFVSVVIPCFNEEHFIGKVLETLIGQYDSRRYEIIVVDGGSTDKTREVVQDFMARTPEVSIRLVDNPARNIPAALNIGIREAVGDIIVRMDAHSIPANGYIECCLKLLDGPNVSVVGATWVVYPGAKTLIARAIALAVSHPFGVGDADYRRVGLTDVQDVDTVPFGVFRKSLWQTLGGFNEKLLANEDYDFNYRARRLGGRILLDPSGPCNYFARPRLRDLARQYFRYGHWKAQMVKLHPRSLRWRQVVAPLFVVALIVLTALSVWRRLALAALPLVVVPYVALAVFFAYKLSRREGDWRLLPAIAGAFLIMHLSWGSSFLAGLIHSPHR